MMSPQDTRGWKLLEPIKVDTMSLRNRMVMSPMLTCLAASDNTVTKEMTDYYSERAKGGIGAIITEYCYIDNRESQARGHQLGVYSDHSTPGLSKLAETIRAGGAEAILQICHAGRQSSKAVLGRQPVAPSAVPNFGEMPKELTIAEIKEIEDAFAEAAWRAKQAGFNGVEIHGANGYLLSQFLAPYTNRRSDRYGGELKNRASFALETIAKVRKKVGNQFTVGYRMNGCDYVPDGITLDEAAEFSKMLQDAGINYIHVSAGIQESWHYVIQPMYLEQACLVHLAERVKKAVRIPVITVGSHTVETAEKALREDKADLVAFGRSLIADPQLPRKLAAGRIEDIRPCIRGNEGCVSNTRLDQPIRCEVNPAAGREAGFRVIPATKKKNIVVIGGGMAGMEAARVASLRGHEVMLIEKAERLGGHLLEASVPKFKDTLKALVNWSTHQLDRDRIAIKLRTEVTSELVQELKPDTLIIAVGSNFISPKVRGMDRPLVAMPDDILLGKKPVGESVVVIGAGTVGCETALYLAEELDKNVVIVEKQDEALPEATFINRPALMERLETAAVKVYVGWCLEKISDKGVICADKRGQRHELEANTVVLALGLQAREKLVEKFKALAPKVDVIGDCNEARDIYHAFEDAWRAVLSI